MNRSKWVLLIGFGLCFVVVAVFVVIIQQSVHVSFAIRTALELPRDTAWMISAARPKDAVAQLRKLFGTDGWDHVVARTGIRWDHDAELEQIGIEPNAYLALSAVDVADQDFVLSLGLTKQAQSIPYLKHSLTTALDIPESSVSETTLGRWPALWVKEGHRTWAVSVRQSRCLIYFSAENGPDTPERLRRLAEKVDKTKEKFSLADVSVFRRSVEQERSPLMYVYASPTAIAAVLAKYLPEVQSPVADTEALVWAVAEDPSAKLFHAFRWYGGTGAAPRMPNVNQPQTQNAPNTSATAEAAVIAQVQELVKTYVADTLSKSGYENVQITSQVQPEFVEWTVVAAPASSRM